ncbi:MAG: helix-turn-helix transcriptional regulator [Armatimonadetes bacterium]|nr:helix-turn-helix transcriptional regulator [Armatimonadota bacterium]
MKHPPSTQAFGPVINRFTDVMAHSDRFAFKGTTRLALDAGVSPSSVSRLIHGEINPSFVLVARLTAAVEKELGFRIDPRDLVAESGRFLTCFTCGLVGCRGCLPDNARDEFGSLKPAYEGVAPGTWVTSRYPKGYSEKGVR